MLSCSKTIAVKGAEIVWEYSGILLRNSNYFWQSRIAGKIVKVGHSEPISWLQWQSARWQEYNKKMVENGIGSPR